MSADLAAILPGFSEAIAARVAAATPLLLAVRGPNGRSLNAIAWRPDIVVTSEQALRDRDAYTLALPDGTTMGAAPGGRDPGTNVAILRPGQKIGSPEPEPAEEPHVGALALVLGRGADTGPTAQLAVVSELGPAWHSAAGGRIDRLIRLDLRAGRLSEGALVVDAAGRALGMAAAGPRGQVLVIPHATIARTLDPLLAEGRIARGWLGVGLQPVMVPPSLREAVGQEQGRMIVSIAAGGPAEQAGLLPGDILLKIDGHEAQHVRSLMRLLGPERVGKPLPLRLLRAGEARDMAVTVGGKP